MDEYNYLFKCVVVGDSSVGKTQFINIASNYLPFNSDQKSTIGIDFRDRIINVRDKKIKLRLWDTMGAEIRLMTSAYRGSLLTFLFFDLSNRSSFENLTKWMFNSKVHSEAYSLIILIGNKSDLDKTVSQEEIDKYIADNKCDAYYELSCKKTPEIINNILNNVAQKLLLTQTSKHQQKEHTVIKEKDKFTVQKNKLFEGSTKVSTSTPTISKPNEDLCVKLDEIKFDLLMLHQSVFFVAITIFVFMIAIMVFIIIK